MKRPEPTRLPKKSGDKDLENKYPFCMTSRSGWFVPYTSQMQRYIFLKDVYAFKLKTEITISMTALTLTEPYQPESKTDTNTSNMSLIVDLSPVKLLKTTLKVSNVHRFPLFSSVQLDNLNI